MITIKVGTRYIIIILFTVIGFMAVNNISAQQTMGDKLKAMTPQQRADYQTGQMKTKLHLDTQQIVKVKVVNLKYAQKIEPLIKSDDSRFTKFREFKKLQAAKDAELKGIFNAGQFKLYQDYESDMKEKMKEKAKN
jgi:anion-transporting  ArsA/GET3 family ATPase